VDFTITLIQRIIYLQVSFTIRHHNHHRKPSISDPHGQPSLGSVAPSSVWKRPSDVIPTSSLASLPLLPHDIIQNIVNDCSVCASIAVCIQHHLRFNSNVCFLSFVPHSLTSLAVTSLFSLSFSQWRRQIRAQGPRQWRFPSGKSHHLQCVCSDPYAYR